MLTLEATGDGIMEAAVLMVYEERFRPAEKRSSEWTEAQWSKVSRSIAAVEARWMPLLTGPLNMAQIAVACALDYVDSGWRRATGARVIRRCPIGASGSRPGPQ